MTDSDHFVLKKSRNFDSDEESDGPSPNKSVCGSPNPHEEYLEKEVDNHNNVEEHQQAGTSEGISTKNANLVASHYNELQEKGIDERKKSRIFFMRNFNNWIKSMLISEFLRKVKEGHKLGDPVRVLDMCCGKGGDLLKWQKGGITHLICTDIADISVDQCKARYEDMKNRSSNMSGKFSAEFFACDSSMVRLREHYKDPSMKLNLVSCQFALHYGFESITQADVLVRNAAECLQPGGFFIATIPDANEIMRRHQQAGTKSFGNEIYNIEFCCDTNPPSLFGAKYNFHLEGVVDCPEFLVHFPTLVKLCRKHGLQLYMKNSFSEYYKANQKQGAFLLNRMKALETYPAQGYDRLCGEENEYVHAQAHLGSGYNRRKIVGTLSKSDWEASTLYLVCAFKKCKNTWDAEGKAVYSFDD